MRELNIGTKKHTTVVCLDEPGQGGACHKYRVYSTEKCQQIKEAGQLGHVCDTQSDLLTQVYFQNGPVKEFGLNGCHNEDLIAIVIDRLEHFQKGSFKCRENALALTKLEEALHWLRHRTNAREARGVEGTNVV